MQRSRRNRPEELYSESRDPEDVLRAVGKSRQKIIDCLEPIQKIFEETKFQNEPSLDEAREVVKAVHKQIAQTLDELDGYGRKEELREATRYLKPTSEVSSAGWPDQGIVNDNLRQVVQLRRGAKWTAENWIRSGSDIVSYIAGLTNESEEWIRHATSRLIDELKHSVGV